MAKYLKLYVVCLFNILDETINYIILSVRINMIIHIIFFILSLITFTKIKEK
jgi:hypothetical protein